MTLGGPQLLSSALAEMYLLSKKINKKCLIVLHYIFSRLNMKQGSTLPFCSMVLLVMLSCHHEVAGEQNSQQPQGSCVNWMAGTPGHPGHNGEAGRDGRDGRDGQKGEKGEQGDRFNVHFVSVRMIYSLN